jgi:hypothetical protein
MRYLKIFCPNRGFDGASGHLEAQVRVGVEFVPD